ncbi:MAG: Bax inhibitor-1/YccA family protein [Clostridium sp.]|uniref:Bax inhibitor-1/YccA family protein n=1 Tax=Clostridium sp. TaxID=1506 RepID=UPI003EE5A603
MKIGKANPAMTKGFKEVESIAEHMTVSGTIGKILILLVVVVLGFLYSWFRIPYNLAVMIIVSLITFGVAMFTIVNQKLARFTGIIYAGLEGLMIGSISKLFERVYPGIVIPAILLTFTCVIITIAIYGKNPNIVQRTRKAVMIGLISVLVTSFLGILLSFVGIRLPIYDSGIIGIGFSLVVIVIATLCLIQDYDFLLQNVKEGAPKYMEWYGAFGLMVTLIWLYLEILDLLRKFVSND